jgi:hypothetical protein
MNLGALDGDRIVQLLGIVMALALVSSGSTFRAMPWRKRALYAAMWVGIIGMVAVIAGVLAR